VDDLKNMVMWFKLPSDHALPTCIQDIIDRYDQMKLRTLRDTILPAGAPVHAASIPALQALMNPMPTLVLASVIDMAALQALMNTLGLASMIGPAVDLAPPPIIAPLQLLLLMLLLLPPMGLLSLPLLITKRKR
jgi:hypothetical protein